jgi:hypothetical protein
LETCLMKIQEIIISFYDSIKTITLIANWVYANYFKGYTNKFQASKKYKVQTI